MWRGPLAYGQATADRILLTETIVGGTPRSARSSWPGEGYVRSMTLIAEDLLLILLDDEKGTVSTWGKTDAVLGGAVLAELAVAGLVTVDDHKSIWRTDKVRASEPAPADLDPVLAEAL